MTAAVQRVVVEVLLENPEPSAEAAAADSEHPQELPDKRYQDTTTSQGEFGKYGRIITNGRGVVGEREEAEGVAAAVVKLQHHAKIQLLIPEMAKALASLLKGA